MPKQSTDYLLNLIKRLTPAEKRHFKINVTRKNFKEAPLFFKLFDELDKSKSIDEKEILRKIPEIKKVQLANVKANLYKQLLSSLRVQMKTNQRDIAIREQIDFARVLYTKGLYHGALNTLERTKRLAEENQLFSIVQNILEFEKNIEGMYITGSMSPKARALTTESEKNIKSLSLENKLSNLSLSLYGLYLQYGYVKNERDFNFVTDYFKTRIPELDEEKLGFYGKLHLYQSYVWYYNMVQNFVYYYKYAQKWVDLFLNDDRWIKEETTLCLKGYHNVLNGLFMCQKSDKFQNLLEEFKSLELLHNISYSESELSMFKLFELTQNINLVYLTGKYEDATDLADEISSIIRKNPYNWDTYRLMMFDYKVACLYFGAADLGKCIYHLNRITNLVRPKFRGDIQCFARILNIIAHFDLGNESLVSHQIRSTYRFISNMENLQKVQQEIFSFLRRTPSMTEVKLINEFKKLKGRLQILKKDPYERRPFLYLDIISWLDSKIEGITMAEAVRRNAFFG